MKIINVDLGDRSYPIYIGSGLMSESKLLTPHVVGKQVMIVSNTTVAPLYLEKAKGLFADKQVSEVILPDGECYKNWETLNLIFDKLLSERHSRNTTLVALGGGVVGDMTGFAAAAYQRGVNFIQIPTTLLSQVDSSVGGKTGINHPLGKNMIGAFHQPQAVLIDVDTLQTLEKRELSAGMAEVIKYGLIRNKPFFDWINTHVNALMKLSKPEIIYAIETSCLCKAEVVAADERESSVRAILNLGHTFGHAIEAHMGYGNWLHGEAVGAGMVMAARLSEKEGYLNASEVQQIIHLVEMAGLPSASPADMNENDFLDKMMVDKKVMDGTLRLVLLKALGEAVVTADFSQTHLTQTLAEG
jgi:3-dehydroquinate synthase